MSYHLLGLNHKTAPLDLREKLAVQPEHIPETLRSLAGEPQVEEAFVLSTCNRVEFIARAKNGHADLRSFVLRRFGVDAERASGHFYEHSGEEAVRHLFRVASSLDSMVVGEPQILGQVKEAYAIARSAGTVTSQLDALLTRSFAVAKRVRRETAIGSSSVSVASVAVELAEKIFGSLNDKTVLIVGAGKMSDLAARHFRAAGVSHMLVANRTVAHGRDLADRFEADLVEFERLPDILEQADIVLTSTGSSQPLFVRADAERLVHRRKNRPVFFIDIAVPRDVDPEVAEVDGVFVYDIDDLQQVVSGNQGGRRREAALAEKIIDAEVRSFAARVDALNVVPTIVSLQDQFEMIRQAEIDRARGRLGALSPEQEKAIEAMTQGIVNKILHAPITSLKSAAVENKAEVTTLVELVRRIFRLESESAARRSGR